MKIIGIVGWSGSGKTTLIVNLLPALRSLDYQVSTIKHAHHDFDMDTPGKDTYAHREAGATEVLVASTRRWALMHELEGEPEPTLDDLVANMMPVDFLLVEGFKAHAHPKIEVHRPALNKPMLQPDDPNIIAVASDTALSGLSVPTLDMTNAEAIAHYIVEHFSRRAA